MRKLLLIFCFTALLLTQPSAVATADEPAGLTMTAQAAFGGRFKYGEWLPIFVNVENPGAELTGEIRVSITNQAGRLDFLVPAELPAGARKRFTVYTLPNNFSRSAKVELVQGEEILLIAEVNLSVLLNDRYVIGIVAPDATGMAMVSPPTLPGRRERPETLTLSIEEIPDRHEGLRLLNTLILNDVDSSLLTPAQRTALKNWVAGGGRLVLGGGAGAGRTLAGLPLDLQPVTLTNLQEVSAVPGLETYADEPVRVPGPFLLAGAQPVSDATVLLTQAPPTTDESEKNLGGSDIPLIVELAVGQGYVDFIALDLSQSPFNAWAGATDFVQQLLSPGAAWPDYLPPDIAPHQMSDSQMTYALSNLPALDLPSIRFLGLLLIGYILLVGPANYFFLRWRDRLAWAWITIPALTLAFSALAYGLGFSLRGSDIIVNQISIIEMGPDGEASQGRTYVGVFSPHRRAYNIEVEEKSLIRPLGEGGYDPWSGSINTAGTMSVVQSEPARVRGLTVNQWSMQSFVAETVPTEAPGLVSQLTVEREGLHGRLVNQGNLAWQDVVVVFNGRFQKLGDIAPGQSADIRLDLSNDTQASVWFSSYLLFEDEFNRPTGPSREINFKQSVLDNTIFNNDQTGVTKGPFIIGWLKDSFLQVRLEDNEITTQKASLVYGPLPLTFDGSHVVVPPGFSHPETLSLSGESYPCRYGGGIEGYSVYQGTVETRLVLPPSLHNVQPDWLDLYISTDGSWPTLPPIELYDQIGDEWVLLAGAKEGANPIEEIDRFYEPDSASVRLRISSGDAAFSGGGCLFLDLAMEGER
jgi:hypothetical protein